jgi:hypothetical protein
MFVILQENKFHKSATSYEYNFFYEECDNLKMEAAWSSDTLVSHMTTRCHKHRRRRLEQFLLIHIDFLLTKKLLLPFLTPSRSPCISDFDSTGWTIGVLGFESRRGLGIFLFTTASRTALGPTQPPIQWVRGSLSLGVKRPGRLADHSRPSSAEVKNSRCTSTPQYVFMEWCLVKHRDNFTFTLQKLYI